MRIDYSPNDANNTKIVCRQYSLCPYGLDNGAVLWCVFALGRFLGVLCVFLSQAIKLFMRNVKKWCQSLLAIYFCLLGDVWENQIWLFQIKSVKSSRLFVDVLKFYAVLCAGLLFVRNVCFATVTCCFGVSYIAVFNFVKRNGLENKESCVA